MTLVVLVVAFALIVSGIWTARRDVFLDGAMLYVERYAQLFAYFVIAFLFRNHLPPVNKLLYFSVGSFAVYLVIYFTMDIMPMDMKALLLVRSIAAGMANAGIFLLLMHTFSSYAPKFSALAIACACVLAEFVFALTALMPPIAIVIVQPLFKGVGLSLFLYCFMAKRDSPISNEEHPLQYGLLSNETTPQHPLRFLTNSSDWIFQLILAVAFPFVFGFMSQLLSAGGLSDGLHDIGNETITIAFLLLVVSYCAIRGSTLSFDTMFFSVTALYAVGLLLFPLLYVNGNALYSGTFIKMGNSLYSLLLWVLLARKSFEDPRHTYLYFGVFCGLANVSYGRLLEPLIMKNVEITPFVAAYVAVVFLFVLFLCNFILFLIQRHIAASDGVEESSRVGTGEFNSTATMSEIDVFSYKVKTFCKQHNLTKREHEVLTEALHGYSMKNIADKLFCSPETVRTHMKNIYSKCNAQNKQALISYIDNQKISTGKRSSR